ncbi:hypothetical protein Tco_0261338 [Tanacetum coccineum]
MNETLKPLLLMGACLEIPFAVSYLQKVELIDGSEVDLVSMFKTAYSNPQIPLMHLGAMLGVVNALGAGDGTVFLHFPLSLSWSSSEQKSPIAQKVVMESEDGSNTCRHPPVELGIKGLIESGISFRIGVCCQEYYVLL